MIDPNSSKQQPLRTNILSHPSILVNESLLLPSYQKQKLELKYTAIPSPNIQSIIEIDHKYSDKNLSKMSLPLLTQINNHQTLLNSSRNNIPKKDDSRHSQLCLNQKLKLDSNIKPIANEFNDFMASSNIIYSRQQKPFDIIKGTEKNYKSEINLFPKLRLQRFDHEFQKRQAFIRGDMRKIKNLQQRTRSERKFFLNRNYSELNNFQQERRSLRKRQPIEFAFKITENPEIIKKKLLMEK